MESKDLLYGQVIRQNREDIKLNLLSIAKQLGNDVNKLCFDGTRQKSGNNCNRIVKVSYYATQKNSESADISIGYTNPPNKIRKSLFKKIQCVFCQQQSDAHAIDCVAPIDESIVVIDDGNNLSAFQKPKNPGPITEFQQRLNLLSEEARDKLKESMRVSLFMGSINIIYQYGSGEKCTIKLSENGTISIVSNQILELKTNPVSKSYYYKFANDLIQKINDAGAEILRFDPGYSHLTTLQSQIDFSMDKTSQMVHLNFLKSQLTQNPFRVYPNFKEKIVTENKNKAIANPFILYKFDLPNPSIKDGSKIIYNHKCTIKFNIRGAIHLWISYTDEYKKQVVKNGYIYNDTQLIRSLENIKRIFIPYLNRINKIEGVIIDVGKGPDTKIEREYKLFEHYNLTGKKTLSLLGDRKKSPVPTPFKFKGSICKKVKGVSEKDTSTSGDKGDCEPTGAEVVWPYGKEVTQGGNTYVYPNCFKLAKGEKCQKSLKRYIDIIEKGYPDKEALAGKDGKFLPKGGVDEYSLYDNRSFSGIGVGNYQRIQYILANHTDPVFLQDYSNSTDKQTDDPVDYDQAANEED